MTDGGDADARSHESAHSGNRCQLRGSCRYHPYGERTLIAGAAIADQVAGARKPVYWKPPQAKIMARSVPERNASSALGTAGDPTVSAGRRSRPMGRFDF